VIGALCAPAKEPPTAAAKAAPAHLIQKLLIVPSSPLHVFATATSLPAHFLGIEVS
jgi:hypothetical protein